MEFGGRCSHWSWLLVLATVGCEQGVATRTDGGVGRSERDGASLFEDSGASEAVLCVGGREMEQVSLSPPGALSARTGLYKCADEAVHRARAVVCEEQFAQLPTEGCEDGGALWDGGCGRLPGYCLEDGDCTESEACLCSSGKGQRNACVSANCWQDADCGEYECGASPGRCGYDGLYCRTAQDECHGSEDCPGGPADTCAFNGAFWSCTDFGSCE